MYTYAVMAVDPDGDALTFSLPTAPTDMRISATGLISWTASYTGSETVVVSVSDGSCAAVQPYRLEMLSRGVDLTVTAVDIATFATEATTLVATGPIQVGVRNAGGTVFSGQYDVLLFADGDGDALYNNNVDQLLGSGTFSNTIGPAEIVTTSVTAAGVVQFRDNLVYAFVDSRQAVPELDEGNNVGHSGLSSRYQPVRDWLPTVEWAWNASSLTWGGMQHPPVVAPITDTNGDNQINELDVPAVIMAMSHQYGDGRLVALHGVTGEELFNVPLPNGGNFSTQGHTPAVGDLDGDGLPEIVVPGPGGYTLHVFNHDGTFEWQTTTINGNASNPLLANVDEDAAPEIVYNVQIFNGDGSLQATARQPQTNYGGGYGSGRHVADLDLDGIGEIVAGPSVYDGAGNALWYWDYDRAIGEQFRMLFTTGNTTTEYLMDEPFGESWTAVANIDSDPYPEIIMMGRNYNTFVILEHDGQLHQPPQRLFTNIAATVDFDLGPPTIADFDGDGAVEIAVSVNQTFFNNTFADPSRLRLLLYETDGTLIWERSYTPEDTSNVAPAPSAFDFDGDGVYEILFLDVQRLVVVDGVTGDTLYETAINRVNDGLVVRYPTIADVDNDGNAEILVPTYYSYQTGAPTRNGLLVVGDAHDNWPHARRVWNQWHYQASNVYEDATIPTQPDASWLSHNTYRAQLPMDGLDVLAAPDLTVSRVIYHDDLCPSSVGLTARIGNGGALQAAPGQLVTFYQGDPLSGSTVLTRTTTSQPLYPGQFEDVTVPWLTPTAEPVYVTVNERVPSNLTTSSNLAQLPHTYAEASGFCDDGCRSVNRLAFRGIDGNPYGGWFQNLNGRDSDPRPSFYEVHFPFPVNATTITVTNGYVNAGFLSGVASFSNGFTTTFTFDEQGEGVITFPEQQGITWLRLTADSEKSNGIGLYELMVAGSYRLPQQVVNEGHVHNNMAVAGRVVNPCHPPANQPPVITSAPVIAASVGQGYAYEVTAVDPDDDMLTFGLPQAPAGMNITSDSGLITWQPVAATTVTVTVQVTDTAGLTDTQRFTLDVLAANDVNHPPQITTTPLPTVAVASLYVYPVAATDLDGDLLRFGLLTAPEGMVIDPVTGQVDWTPTEDQAGLQVVAVTVQDVVTTTQQVFTVTVVSRNLPLDPLPLDQDGDNWLVPEDCDDLDPLVHPGQLEIVGNGRDDDCNPATLDNDPTTPSASLMDDAAVMAPNTTITLPVLANDEGITADEVTGLLLSSPGVGTAVVAAPNQVVYTPAPDFMGLVTFTYQVTASSPVSGAAQISILVGRNNSY